MDNSLTEYESRHMRQCGNPDWESAREPVTNGHLGQITNGYVDVVTQAATTGELSAKHRQKLTVESAISEDAIKARGYFTQHDKHALELLGFGKYQARQVPALVIPLYRYNGEQTGYVIRPDIPRNTSTGNTIKYESLPKVPPVLDVAPLTRHFIGDPTKPLIITEGAKKADAAASRGLCAINLNGVYGFKDTNTALADWEFITLKGRNVFIAYDSDVVAKRGVNTAMRRLHNLLQSRGAIVKVLYLPEGEDGAKTGLDDYFAHGGTVENLFALARDLEPIDPTKRKEKEKAKAERMAEFKATGKPVIETYDRNLPDILSPFADVIAAYNGNAPTLFHGTGGMCEISKDEDGKTILEPMVRERLQVITGNGAIWTRTKNEVALPTQITPTQELCSQYLSSKELWRNIPPIRRILTAPFVDSNGNICSEPGYHATAKVWLSLPDNYLLPDTTPTPENIKKARDLIEHRLLKEVEFADRASFVNAVALMILPFMRLYIDALQDGQTPIHLFDAPAQSSGKTYAAKVCLMPFCEAIETADKSNVEEAEKEIFAQLLGGASYIFIDNVRGALNSATLATAVTSGRMQGRVLGASAIKQVESNIVWAATSNNAQLDADTVSRSILIQIDTNTERPEERQFSFNPIRYITDNRAEVQGALLTLIRAWFNNGKPERQKKVSRFPAWERVIGGILDNAGIPGFLDNHQNGREIADTETDVWRGFIETWKATHGADFVTVKQLLQMQDIDDMMAFLGDKNQNQKFGKQLQSRKNRIINGYKIEKEQVKGTRKMHSRWRLLPTKGIS